MLCLLRCNVFYFMSCWNERLYIGSNEKIYENIHDNIPLSIISHYIFYIYVERGIKFRFVYPTIVSKFAQAKCR